VIGGEIMEGISKESLVLSAVLVGAALAKGEWVGVLKELDSGCEPWELQKVIELCSGKLPRSDENLRYAASRLGLGRDGTGKLLDQVSRRVRYFNWNRQRGGLERALLMCDDLELRKGLELELKELEGKIDGLFTKENPSV
jgi:hypothetical protein